MIKKQQIWTVENNNMYKFKAFDFVQFDRYAVAGCPNWTPNN